VKSVNNFRYVEKTSAESQNKYNQKGHSFDVRPKSKDIKRVHSMKNAVFRTSHGFAKPRHLHAIKSKLNIPKKNLICQQPVQSLRFQSKPGRLYRGR
jgi:acyl-homoserine lactone acylase PvdQ